MTSKGHVPRVYVDAALGVGQSLTLPDAKRHHLATVLRLVADTPVTLFNGDGGEYDARLAEASRKRVVVEITARRAPARESPMRITLVQAIARGDRMDFALAKAVELGVAHIRPLFTTRGQVRLDGARLNKKQAHWRAVVESAAEQSGRLVCPEVAPAVNLSQLIKEPADDRSQRLMLAPGAAHGLAAVDRAERVTLLVGPESGLSEDEIEHAGRHGWQPLALGPRVLRTETAGMAALATIQALWGDLTG